MESLLQDIRFAVRGLRRRPGLSLVMIVTLALGIGANTAIFSVVHSVLLAPLPYRDPDALVVLWAKNEKRNVSQAPVSHPNIVDWREQNQVFQHLAAIRGESFSLTDGDEPERVSGVRVSADILSLLGVQPVLGRGFLPAEEQPGLSAVALIGYGLWQRRYAGSTRVIGQTLIIDGRPYTAIGVLPPWLKHPGQALANLPPEGAEIWIPLVPAANEQNRGFANMRVLARLKPGMTLVRAQEEMNAIAGRLERQYPDFNTGLRADVIPLHDHLTGSVRRALWVLLGVVGCVLLIACANVASLMLARSAARQPEMAVRTALGASRRQLIRQLLTESVVLSLSGGLLGLLLAQLSVSLMTSLNAGSIPRVHEIGMSREVLLFTMLLSVLTGIGFGLVPAFQSSQVLFAETRQEGHKGAAGSRQRRRWLGALVVTEIALALVLLSGAGLMLRSIRSVLNTDPGFDPGSVLTLAATLPLASYGDQTRQLRFYERALERIEALPGVRSAAGTFRIPIAGFATVTFTVQGQPVPFGQEPNADYRTVSHRYFRAMGMRLINGREFTERDTAETPDVVIVNEELAVRFWPSEQPVGKRLQIATERTRWREVVGVVANARLSGLEARIDPAIYVPFPQNSWPHALRLSSIVVRTGGDPHSSIPAIRHELRSIDPALPLTQFRTMEEVIGQSLSQRRFNTALLSLFALVAGLLAAVGIYGVMSYAAAQRSREMGIRMALGAQRSDIVKMILGDAARLALAGIAIGLAGAALSTRVMAGLLFGVSATDPLTFVAISVSYAAVTVLAGYVPARRAAGTDPITAMRHE